jgi:hypothetical protein
MKKMRQITKTNPAACGVCDVPLKRNDRVKRCEKCNQYVHASCWDDSVRSCPIRSCRKKATGMPVREFKGGMIFREVPPARSPKTAE